MDIAGSNGAAFQDSGRLRENQAGRNQAAEQQLLRDQARQDAQAPAASGSLVRSTSIEAPEQTAPSRASENNQPRFPSDPDRVTLSRDALLAARDDRQSADQSAVIDNDTGELVPQRPEPPAQNRTALNAYDSVQNLSGV